MHSPESAADGLLVRTWAHVVERPIVRTAGVVLLALVILLFLFFLPGLLDGEPPSGTSELGDRDELVDADIAGPPSEIDGEDTQPAATTTLVALTDGPWRFFRDESESQPLYDFVFSDDGTFHERGDERNHGTYLVSGATVELVLTRTQTMPDGQDAQWTERFTMTRVDDTMTGTWETTHWSWGPEEGFLILGTNEPAPGIHARPV